MPEIMSREEFENCNPLNVSTQGVVWQSHLEAQAATIEALAEALHLTGWRRETSGVWCSEYTTTTSSNELMETLRDEGWL